MIVEMYACCDDLLFLGWFMVVVWNGLESIENECGLVFFWCGKEHLSHTTVLVFRCIPFERQLGGRILLPIDHYIG